MWAQYDFGDGPRIGGAATVLFCWWLAWSRFRVVVVVPLLDKTWPSVAAAADVALRRAGGVPTCLLTDNEKAVTVEHVAGLPVRNAAAVEFGRHYGLTVATCVLYDPASKGGSESTVKIAKADLVPTDANLRPEYASFAELEAPCLGFCGQVNTRPHRITRRAPAEMLAEERARLHPVPAAPLTAALRVTRKVDGLSLVLTCPMFVTTAEFLPQHHTQRQATLQIISAAETAGHARVAEMNRQVARNLDKIIATLEDEGTGEKEASAGAS